MRTRSQTKSITDLKIQSMDEPDVNVDLVNMIPNTKPYYGEFELEYDFDNASKLWNANKKKLENACYIYVCGYLKSKTGKKCMNKTSCGVFCRFHKNK
jgi:hypothetical protein